MFTMKAANNPLSRDYNEQVNAHEMRKSLWQFLFAANIGLSPSTLSHFALYTSAAKNCTKSLKSSIFHSV